MGKRGPKKTPAETKRRRGNPGKRPLPELAEVTPIPPAERAEPDRPLGATGRSEWDRAWDHAGTWLAESDTGALLRYCEAADDYTIRRRQMLLANQQDPEPRTAWRLWKQVGDLRRDLDRMAQGLGMTPAGRSELGVAEVRVELGHALLEREHAIAVIDIDPH